jgi:uncharacterized protein YjaZ
MLKIIRFLFLMLFINTALFAQSKISKKADSLYHAKNYTEAADSYLKAGKETEFKASKKSFYYNAACAYALAGKKDSALITLKKAIDNGYKNIEHIKKDVDFNSLHELPAWNTLVNAIKVNQGATHDPLKAKLVTIDIKNYWKAYDLAQKDTANRLNIFKKYYVDPGTEGLQDYFASKVYSMGNFVRSQDQKPKFYAAIRNNTFTVEKQKPQMIGSFKKFKHIYPKATFPAIYFVIGAFTSGGTVSEAGLLIGLDQSAGGPGIPEEELNLWQRNNLGKVNDMPYLIAHELIHFNQNGIKRDTTLLCAALIEGMSDFIGELISGRTANERLHVWVKGKEQQVWTDFRKEMYLQRAQNWIGNSNQETAEKPADLGYWIGYQICKAYYDRSADKNKAVAEMLNITDFKDFYEKSGAVSLGNTNVKAD